MLGASLRAARLLLFLVPEGLKSLPDNRAKRLASRVAELIKKDVMLSALTYGHKIHHFLDDLGQRLEGTTQDNSVVEKLSLHSSNDGPLINPLIRGIAGSLCGRPDIKTERDLYRLAYPTGPKSSEGSTPYEIVDGYVDFETSYAILSQDDGSRRGVVLPVVDEKGDRVPGAYVGFRSGGLSKSNNLGSTPFDIDFVFLPPADSGTVG